LAYQLSRNGDGFLLGLVEVLERDADEAKQNICLQVEELLVKPFAFSHCTNSVLVVLDAPDECDFQLRAQELLQNIVQAVPKLPSHIKLLITSRPENHIRSIFNRSLTHDQLILHNIDNLQETVCTEPSRFYASIRLVTTQAAQ
jgi:hypothetical protein